VDVLISSSLTAGRKCGRTVRAVKPSPTSGTFLNTRESRSRPGIRCDPVPFRFARFRKRTFRGRAPVPRQSGSAYVRWIASVPRDRVGRDQLAPCRSHERCPRRANVKRAMEWARRRNQLVRSCHWKSITAKTKCSASVESPLRPNRSRNCPNALVCGEKIHLRR
jgi:hypothetical protein